MKDSQFDRQRASRRRNVALLGVVGIALVVAVGYNFWSAKQGEVTPHERTAADFVVTWRCLGCGHEEDGRGEARARTCPECGKEELYVCIRHACPRHGVFPVAFQYDEQFEPVRLKIADGDWVPYADEDENINTHCPRCDQIMLPAETARPAPRKVENTPG